MHHADAADVVTSGSTWARARRCGHNHRSQRSSDNEARSRPARRSRSAWRSSRLHYDGPPDSGPIGGGTHITIFGEGFEARCGSRSVRLRRSHGCRSSAFNQIIAITPTARREPRRIRRSTGPSISASSTSARTATLAAAFIHPGHTDHWSVRCERTALAEPM